MRAIILGLGLVIFAAIAGSSPSVQAGGGCHSDEQRDGLTDAAADSVTMPGCQFQPAVLRVRPGTEVTFENSGRAPHTVTGVAGTWGDLETLNSGDWISYTLGSPGVFPYFCEFHPGMVGAVVVGDGVWDGSPSPATSTGLSRTDLQHARAISPLPATAGTEPDPTAISPEDQATGGSSRALIAALAAGAVAIGMAGIVGITLRARARR